ncbi:helix-turn-helix domain containing protein [Flavonifractor sp. DFI.6.63]|uniref:helix-turn-helix domain-containing protein n=1 Tax=Flavonifractor sp. DFI.6.63 TaxID=2963704 RepID=UPI00210DE264|nr:helix-turn-helix domain-containing protein [Flavonifractor sp. DFI.6.63]MCQ5030639.1 helix-turn-helix domain containing protein [Flavonifractor sp. DFI.6.63]
MSLKSNIPPELKIQAVEDYLAIRKGSTQIREELGIRLSTFQAWLRKYQTEGPAGLHPKKGFTSYPSSLKLVAVEDYFKRRRVAGRHVPKIRDFLPCGFAAMDYVV